jgi:hypothetical protein
MDQMRRIKIPLPLTAKKEEVIEDVDKDKQYAMDAYVARIMNGCLISNFTWNVIRIDTERSS